MIGVGGMFVGLSNYDKKEFWGGKCICYGRERNIRHVLFQMNKGAS